MATPHPALRCVLAVLAAAGGASCAREPVAGTRELDWSPRLDQPIRQLEEILAATEQQQPRNYTSANLGFALDAKLYLLFERYLSGVPGRTRPAVLDEQRWWLRERKRATSEAYAEYAGGTLASHAGNRAFIEVTKERIAEIERRLGPALAPTARERPPGPVPSSTSSPAGPADRADME